MKKIKLEHSHQVTYLFQLLSISESNLCKMYDLLLSLCSRKENAVRKRNYDSAAELRFKERQMIQRIIEALNKKGILNNNVLEIYFIKPAN